MTNYGALSGMILLVNQSCVKLNVVVIDFILNSDPKL